MSREERRAYQRQMKGMERGAALPPAAKARAERNAARRARRASPTAGRPGAFTARSWMLAIAIAAVVGIVGFSLWWENGMPNALYVGLAAGGAALAILVGLRYFQRRATS